MGSAPLRITRISENLRNIQNEIALLADEDLLPAFDTLPLGECDVHALRRVKSSVDHLRQVLRTYIEFADAHLGNEDSEAFQIVRMERTSAILRFACQGLSLRERRNREVPASLFEQLIDLAVTAVDRYQPAPEELGLSRAAD